MTFEKADSVIGGSNYTPSNFEDLQWWDDTFITRQTILRPKISKPLDYQQNKSDRLDLEWKDFLFFKGVEIYSTHGGLTYAISETNIHPTDNQLKELLIKSYNQLVKYFKDRQKEQPILPSLPDLSDEKIQQTSDQLKKFLLGGQQ